MKFYWFLNFNSQELIAGAFSYKAHFRPQISSNALDLGPLVIPTSTWDAVLGDQIDSLKLGFAIKRKHDPKGFLDAHFKQNHVKNDYVHEKFPDESIY